MTEKDSHVPSDDPDIIRALERLDLRDAMIAGLAAGANDLAEAATGLVTAARVSRLEKIIALVLLGLSTVSTIAVGIMAVLLIGIAEGNRSNTTLVRDCVTPSGDCYQDNAARTAGVVNRIIESNRIFVMCARVVPPLSDDAFNRCVDEGVAAIPIS